MLRQLLVPLLCGLVFGTGLALSGMTDTRVVLGFLDIAGDWNPALLMVMVGALAVTIPGFWLAQQRGTPLFSPQFFLPASRTIEAKPLIGSVIFGVGWGLYGYCPGPALAALAGFNWQPLLFVVAMAVGVYLEKAFSARSQGRPGSIPP
ncbi:MAG: YeeE/YedE family protein [Gammaproteobacteria bacterium]|nr:YeeE/YedE family protein [Gammaproteobacteria bacterium]